MKVLKVVVGILFVLGSVMLGGFLWGGISSTLYGDPHVFFAVQGFIPKLWRHLLYALGMIVIGGGICGLLGGLGLGMGTTIATGKHILAIPMGLLFGFMGLLMIGLGGAVITIMPGILYILWAVLFEVSILTITLVLYLIAFAIAGGVFAWGIFNN